MFNSLNCIGKFRNIPDGESELYAKPSVAVPVSPIVTEAPNNKPTQTHFLSSCLGGNNSSSSVGDTTARDKTTEVSKVVAPAENRSLARQPIAVHNPLFHSAEARYFPVYMP